MKTAEANQIARFARDVAGLDLSVTLSCGYDHIGATLADTVLQAGMRYQTVVAPRVGRILRDYSAADTTTSLSALLGAIGAEKFLDWRHHEKPTRLINLTHRLLELSIETEDELAEWLLCSQNAESLQSISGIGPKTTDYICRLVGIPTVAVDRHIKNFVSLAGAHPNSYGDTKKLVQDAADYLGIDYSSFDYAIWSYMSQKQEVLGAA